MIVSYNWLVIPAIHCSRREVKGCSLSWKTGVSFSALNGMPFRHTKIRTMPEINNHAMSKHGFKSCSTNGT